MIIILALIAIVAAAKLMSDWGATVNLKQQQKENWDKLQANLDQRKRDASKQNDCYYDSATKSLNPFFYSDGSLKKDTTTGRYYAKGQYWCSADGLDAKYKQVGADVPKPPKG